MVGGSPGVPIGDDGPPDWPRVRRWLPIGLAALELPVVLWALRFLLTRLPGLAALPLVALVVAAYPWWGGPARLIAATAAASAFLVLPGLPAAALLWLLPAGVLLHHWRPLPTRLGAALLGLLAVLAIHRVQAWDAALSQHHRPGECQLEREALVLDDFARYDGRRLPYPATLEQLYHPIRRGRCSQEAPFVWVGDGLAVDEARRHAAPLLFCTADQPATAGRVQLLLGDGRVAWLDLPDLIAHLDRAIALAESGRVRYSAPALWTLRQQRDARRSQHAHRDWLWLPRSLQWWR